jgi:hypothetical protein
VCLADHKPAKEKTMLAIVAVITAHTARRITEFGALLGLIGGLAVAGAAFPGFRRIGLIVGGLLLAVGFVLIIYAVHFGKTF